MPEYIRENNVYTNAIYNFPDLAKNFLFKVNFSFINTGLESIFGPYGSTGLMLRARSVDLPKKETTKLETHFMGSKRVYPGRTNVAHETTIKFDEFQDMQLAKCFYNWQTIIYNHGTPEGAANPDMLAAGGALSDFLTYYAAIVTVDLYDSTNSQMLPYSYKLFDVWPTNNGSVQLNAEDQSKIAPTITFSYGTWSLIYNSVNAFTSNN